jgi:hypothetical protein
LTVGNGSLVDAGTLFLGDLANLSGAVGQTAGSTVNVINQIRVGHFPTEMSTYDVSGGALAVTAASPAANPSGTAEQNGGIYVGVDGTGVMTHTGGSITTNFVVLDNRTDTPAWANMPGGIDRYNRSGAGVLNFRSAYGLIAHNASTAVSFGGGTVRVDNTGTGTGAGANITVPLDATIDAVAATTTTLDTNRAGNGIPLLRDVRGTGTLALTGGGTIVLNTATQQTASRPPSPAPGRPRCYRRPGPARRRLPGRRPGLPAT